MRTNRNGFTLLELLVVMAIIGFLAATLVVAARGLNQRAKIEKAAKLVLRIDTGCEAYFTKFQDYPSPYARLSAAAKSGGASWPTIQSDTMMFDYLGRSLPLVTGYGASTSKVEWLDPFVTFAESETSGFSATPGSVRIVDPWGGAVWYELPGCPHGANYPDFSRGPSSSTNSRFDVTSAGPDGHKDSFDDKTAPKDDVTNFNP